MTKVPFTTRLEPDVLGRLAGQAHAQGFGNARQYAQKLLEVQSLRDEAEIPPTLRTTPGPEVSTGARLMPPEVSREGPLPGESVESFIHRLFPEKKTDCELNTNAGRVR